MTNAPRSEHPSYSVIVRPYLFGQHRIQLRGPGGESDIRRECCTYSSELAEDVAAQLRASATPEALACSWERPWNCEMPGHGRIRLDNREPEDDRRASSPRRRTMKKMKAYRKLVVAVAGVAAMGLNHHFGISAEIMEPALADLIIGLLTAVGVERLRNDPA